MAGVRAVLLRRAHGRFRHRRHRLHRTVPGGRVGRRTGRAGTRPERGLVRSRVRSLDGGTLGGSFRATQGPDRRRDDLRSRLLGFRVFGRSHRTGGVAFRDGTRARSRHAQRHHARQRILPGSATRHHHQCHVLRVPARSRSRRIPGRLDDPSLRLAERPCPRGCHAARPDRAAPGLPAGIGALHGGATCQPRSHPRRAP